MLVGTLCKTTNHTFHAYWPTEGDSRDFAKFSKVGSWVGQQARVLDKKPVAEAVKLLADEFPVLARIEARDNQGRLALWVA